MMDELLGMRLNLEGAFSDCWKLSGELYEVDAR
jgi:hypothetical protein